MYCDVIARAVVLRATLTASSRSRISASAPEPTPLPSFLSSSPGTNSKERMASRLRPLVHHSLAPAFGHQLALLIECLVQELDDAGVGARLALSPGQHLRREVERV